MLWLRSVTALELFGKLPWFWEIVEGMTFPPFQMDHVADGAILWPGTFDRAYLGYCYAKAGRTNDALQILEDVKTAAAEGRAGAFLVAFVYHGLGEDKQAFEWLNKAAANPLEGVHRLKFNPLWNEVTADPRYAAVLKGFSPQQ
jgi:hypothetical protein